MNAVLVFTHAVALPDRAVVQVSGADALTFLQGLLTCDVRQLAANEARYGAMLSPQGKMLADFFLYPCADGVWMETDAARAESLIARLSQYKLRSKITITNASAHWQVVAAPPHALAPWPWPEGSLYGNDTRHPSAGLRGLIPAAATPPEGAFTEYDAHRITLILPDGSRDYTPDRSFPMEIGLDALHAISFTKGCYVGQEVTNRNKHRMVIRKAICRVECDSSLPPSGTPILTADGIEAGELRSSCGTVGLALVRLEHATTALYCEGAALRVTLPAWATETA